MTMDEFYQRVNNLRDDAILEADRTIEDIERAKRVMIESYVFMKDKCQKLYEMLTVAEDLPNSDTGLEVYFNYVDKLETVIKKFEDANIPVGHIYTYMGSCSECGRAVYDTDNYIQDNLGGYVCYHCQRSKTDEAIDGPRYGGAIVHPMDELGG